uniref:Septum formation initiator n=1 Tax=Lactococcus lactis subsp. cremoris TaxID=1359 RepID=A0A1V0PD52_LACLC
MTKNYNLTELRALSSAYGKKEKQVKFSKFIAMPAIISSGLCYVYLTPIFPLKSKKDVILLLLGVFFWSTGCVFRLEKDITSNCRKRISEKSICGEKSFCKHLNSVNGRQTTFRMEQFVCGI